MYFIWQWPPQPSSKWQLRPKEICVKIRPGEIFISPTRRRKLSSSYFFAYYMAGFCLSTFPRAVFAQRLKNKCQIQVLKRNEGGRTIWRYRVVANFCFFVVFLVYLYILSLCSLLFMFAYPSLIHLEIFLVYTFFFYKQLNFVSRARSCLIITIIFTLRVA